MVEYARGGGFDVRSNALIEHEIKDIMAGHPGAAALRSIEMVYRTNGDPEAVAELRRQAKLERKKRSPLELQKAILRRECELLRK